MSELRDARDGRRSKSWRLEGVILWQLREAQNERGGASVSTAMLYGRVIEHVEVSVDEFQKVLQRLVGALAR
ncbi:MAG: hypothetical protein ABJE66_00725 [Deltaproteobacteria bacterium]